MEYKTGQVNDMILEESGIQYHYTYTYYFINEVLSRKYQEKYKSIVRLKKRKNSSKKSTGSTRESP